MGRDPYQPQRKGPLVALPSDFFDDDRNYRIRLCMLVSEADLVMKDSKVYPCDSCDRPIWVHEAMTVPDADVEIHGDVKVCNQCMNYIIARAEEIPQLLASDNSIFTPEQQRAIFEKVFGSHLP